MLYIDDTIHAAKYLIHKHQNIEPTSPILTQGNTHKEALRYLAEIFVKANSPAKPPRVTIEEAYPEKLQQVNE